MFDHVAAVQPCPLPREAVLGSYASRGAYTDCYCAVVPRAVTQAEFVEAFYTTAVFKLERWLIARLLSRPSSDSQARQLAQGATASFAAWSVEQQQTNQLLVAAGRTRSWLMTAAVDEAGHTGTRLYFGSAVVPRGAGAGGRPAMGWQFRALLGFHRLYSRLLLGVALWRLQAPAGKAP